MNNPLTLKATENPVPSQSRMMTFDEANDVRLSALDSLSLSSQILNKTYLAELGHFDVQETTSDLLRSDDVRICQVSRIVLENKQSVLESTAAAYSALGAAGYALFLLLKSDGKDTTLYLGTRGQPYQKQGENAMKLLTQVVNGHFSGSQLNQLSYNEVNTVLDELDDNLQSITAVSGVPSLSLEQREHFMQGIEHFIDAAEGKAYQALILAEPIANQQLETIRNSYLQIATNISPLLKQTATFGENESESIAIGISESVAHSVGTSTSTSYQTGTNSSFSSSKESSYSVSADVGVSFLSVWKAGVSASYTSSQSFSESFGTSESLTTSESTNESTTWTSSTSKTDTTSTGTSRQITIEYQDKNIEQLMKLVDHHLDRVKEARQFGAWNSAAYFLAEDSSMSEALASIFLGLVRGVKSEGEDFALTTWKEKDKTSSVAKWLQQLTHPRLTTPVYNQLNIPFFTPATMVSTKEMAIQLGLPRRSTSAATVIQTEAFGRKVQRANVVNESHHRTVELGNVYHLWNEMVHSPIKLNIDQLTSHVFVSGSTGSGKSNTVYTLLGQLKDDHQIPFMVIEPAKGEYKHVFGNQPGVKVFGTNPKLNELLRINPFKFPDEIHVLEHIDRLIEIFNACWPMYAAMPAVLKEAMLQAYRESGWDLENSCNEFSPAIYPSFKDLLIALEDVIAQSAFSEEVKSNYVGSLVTRVKSLTNGFYGQVFTDREINNQVLFDSNVIIDLSRVGAQETKSLIMGILIMRLSEHRMAYSGMNQPLKHITVLEEAHNILKRTSTEQSSEGANVAGKAVEMLSNAIAEMRTYGEGFIIADQSPSAVDISAIRNTNTKIIMRLPDDADRRLAGKASGVNDKQIEEIAKLAKGVAVVYQNDWLEPVLCKIKHFPTDDNQRFKARIFQEEPFNRKEFDLAVVNFVLQNRVDFPTKFDIDLIEEGLEHLSLINSVRVPLLRAIKAYQSNKQVTLLEDFGQLSRFIVKFLAFDLNKNADALIGYVDNIETFSKEINKIIQEKLFLSSKPLVTALEECLLRELVVTNRLEAESYHKWYEFNQGN